MQATFADLEIHIYPRQEECYPVGIRLDSQQEFPRGYLHADILSWIPSGNSLTDGQNLFNFLFDDRSLHRAWHHAVGQFPHRRIRLWIDTDAPELHAVPWELLHDCETFLAADAATPLSRYLPGVATWGRAVLRGPLRVLAVIANPTDLADYSLISLDVEQERSVLDAAFAALPPNRCHLDFLDAPVTLARLEDKLRADYHILHLVGHGTFSQRQKQAGLYLQDAQGNTEIVTSNVFVAMLKRLDQRPHLVFLAACQTAKRDTADALIGFGPELVRADIPSVVAMQGDIAVPTAQTLSHTFYQQLVRHGKADLAFNEARSTLLTAQRSDAAMPVIFMRLKDGQLWAPPDRHDFYHHIPLPLHYIPRPDIIAPIRAALLEDPAGMALISAVKINALHGMGGIGKTVIARALCDDPEVQAAFPDGILWTTLGSSATEAELRIKLREWLNCLGGVVSGEAPTLDELKSALAQTLENRACLLIVDDVWQRTHVEAFQVGGASCRLLLTTRDAEIPRALGATLKPVDILPVEQAVVLLEQWAKGSLDDTNPDLKQRIVTRLDCLPLAIKLAGAQLQRKDPSHWLEDFDVRKLKLRRVETVHDSLEQTFALSLADLSLNDRRGYINLAIFKEDEAIPFVAIARLWKTLMGLDEENASELLNDLAARALLQLSSSHSEDRSNEESQATLHDLLRDFIAIELGEQGALAAHRALLDAYQATQIGEGWHTAPDDGYLYAHLAYHLDAIDDYRALKALFADDDWLHARVVADDYTYDGYLVDCSFAWARAQAVTISLEGEAPLSLAVADCIHYALIHTSITSLASNYEPTLVARAVETGLWSPKRGVGIARRVVDAEKQAYMAISLLRTGRLSETLCRVAQNIGLEATRAIVDELRQTRVLIELIPQLRGAALQEGLAVVRTIKNERSRAETLMVLAYHRQFTGDSLQEGLALARAIVDEEDRARVLMLLASKLTGNLLIEGFAATNAIKNESSRVKVLETLVPQLTGELLTKGLEAACAIQREKSRAKVLIALAPQLTGNSLTKGVTAARTIKRTWERAKVLVALALQPAADECRNELLTEALAAVQETTDKMGQEHVLAVLTSQLTANNYRGDLLTEALTEARAAKDITNQVNVWAALTPQYVDTMQGQTLTEDLRTARAITDEEKWIKALAVLAPQLTKVVRTQVLTEGLAATCAIADESKRAAALGALAPQSTGDLLAECLTVVHKFTNEGYRTKVLVALAPQFTGKWLVKALTIAHAIKHEAGRAYILAVLAPQLTDKLLTEGLRVAYTIKNDADRAYVLSKLAQQFTDTMRERLLREGLEAARSIRNKRKQAKVLVLLIPLLTEDLLTEALKLARMIKCKGSQARALIALALRLTGEAREEVLAEGLAAARAIVDREERVAVLIILAQHLTGKTRDRVLSEGVTTACSIEHEKNRARVLALLAPHLTGDLLIEGLSAARAIKDEWHRIKVLAALALPLTDVLRLRSLTEDSAVIPVIKDEKKRAEDLTPRALSAHILTPILKDIHRDLLDYLQHLRNRERTELLDLLTQNDLTYLRALGMSQEGFNQIAQSITAICTQWDWL